MKDQVFCVMDCETGGFDENKVDLLTVYIAITDEDFRIIEELDLKLKPNDGRLPVAEAQALEVNKIDLVKHLADPTTITYAEGKEKLIALFKKHLKKKGRYSNIVLLGQNVGFDQRFVWKHLIDFATWESFVSYNVEDTKTACLFLKRCGWLPKEVGTLGSLVDFFNIPKRTAHEAKGDVHMTIDVYKAMIQMMASKKEGGTTQDLISLLEAE
jgi:oligoribonuclease (3'-5' exoribonuclease)